MAITASWCKPCQRDKPKLRAIRDEGFIVAEIDRDVYPEVERDYGVTSLPTYIVLYEGQVRLQTNDIEEASSLLRSLKPHDE